MTILPTAPSERDSLDAHIDLCALRYASLDTRMNNLEEKTDKIEAKLDRLDQKFDDFQHKMAWMLIKAGASIIVMLLGSLAAVSKVAGIW